MDFNKAVQFAQVVNAAYAIDPTDLSNSAGQAINISYGSIYVPYQVVTSIYANDLATDMNPARGSNRVSIGLILQSPSGDVVIAIRGTEGIMEWIQDAQFLPVKYPFVAAAGNTDDGFTAMYGSLTVADSAQSSKVTPVLSTLPFSKPPVSLTICGHSLGGALATLLALDVAANTKFPTPIVYTYASPRVGDPTFVNLYDHVVPNTFRIANRVDLVPKLPLPPLYDHVSGLVELNPIQLGLPPKVLIKLDIQCEHVLNSYLYLLSRNTGGSVLGLAAQCAP
jgi:hypothetical protein